MFTAIQEELLRVEIRVHDGKTQLWNRSGVVPTGAQALTEAAQRLDPEAITASLCSSHAQLHVEGGSSSIECGVCGAPRCDHATGSQSTRGGTSMQHVLGCRQLPIFTRWIGPSKCSSDSKRRVLGQLGGQSPHDPKETSSGGGSDFARVVSATCCRIPHCCGSSGAGRVGSHWIRCTFLETIGWRSASCGFRSGGPAHWHARAMVGSRQQQIPCTHLVESQVRPRLRETEQALLRSHACAEAGVLGRRVFALESAAATVCREAGARVGTNILVRDLDLAPQGRPDSRRLEVVADGLPMSHGAQLAIDTTLVSPMWDATVCHVHAVPGRMEQLSPSPDEERRERIPS